VRARPYAPPGRTARSAAAVGFIFRDAAASAQDTNGTEFSCPDSRTAGKNESLISGSERQLPSKRESRAPWTGCWKNISAFINNNPVTAKKLGNPGDYSRFAVSIFRLCSISDSKPFRKNDRPDGQFSRLARIMV
jgi:hypothetical protein